MFRPQRLTHCWCARRPAGPVRDRRCGSCGRPAGRCRSTGAARAGTGMLRGLPDAGPGHRDHPAAGAPARRRRGDPVLRHRGAAGRGRRRTSRSSPGSGRWSRSRSAPMTDLDRLRPLDPSDVPDLDPGGVRAGGRAGRDAADRLRRRAVHAGQLPDRGRPVHGARPDQGADARRAGAVARPAGPAGRDLGDLPAACRSRPARPRCSCSTRGPGRCPPPTTSEFVLPHSRPCWRRSAGLGVPRIHFGVGTGELLALMRSRRRRRRRRRLAGAAGRGRAADRRRAPRAGQPRPGAAAGGLAGHRRRGAAHRRRRARRRRAHLQPRPRRAARDRSRTCSPGSSTSSLDADGLSRARSWSSVVASPAWPRPDGLRSPAAGGRDRCSRRRRDRRQAPRRLRRRPARWTSAPRRCSPAVRRASSSTRAAGLGDDLIDAADDVGVRLRNRGPARRCRPGR